MMDYALGIEQYIHMDDAHDKEGLQSERQQKRPGFSIRLQVLIVQNHNRCDNWYDKKCIVDGINPCRDGKLLSLWLATKINVKS